MPGEVVTNVTYTLDDENVLTMDYKATTTKPTVIDMGSHFMVNLAGHDRVAIRDHVIQIGSDRYLESRDHLPTGQLNIRGYLKDNETEVIQRSAMADAVKRDFFGKTSKGEDIYKFTLSNKNKVSVSILNFGCAVYEINLPDKDGNVVDVNIGFDNVKDYEENNNYFGVLVGRVANRISGAKFTLDGTSYEVSKNDAFGGHWSHGGFVGFSRRVWDYTVKRDTLILSYTDPDGSEGMPGEVVTNVTYTLDDENVLTMNYKATTTKPTIIDMGSHFMVNLAGHDKGAIRDHVIQIGSDRYLESRDHLPTGNIVTVEEDKIMDFRKPRSIGGDTIERLTGGMSFYHDFLFDKRGEKKFMARAEHPPSKRYIEVYSTNSTVFAYSNYFMDLIVGDKQCKDGAVYKKYGGIEFMPMGYPNSINQENFPQSVVRPGEEYHETAWYKFGITE